MLGYGVVNEEVAELQRALMALDPKYTKILSRSTKKPDDGLFYKDTQAAVRQYQKDHGLKPTGTVDDALFSSLRIAAAEKIAERNAQGTGNADALATAREQAKNVLNKLHVPAFNAADIAKEIIAAAQDEVGKTEAGGENRGEDIKRYRTAAHNRVDGSPWCADLTSYIYNKAAPGLLIPHSMVAGLANQFKKAGANHAVGTYTPKPGDMVFFKGPTGKYAHTGVVTKVEDDGTFHTVEGNVPNAIFDGQKTHESLPKWSADLPDAVRNKVWKPGQVEHGLSVAGFGSLEEMVAKRGTQMTTQLAARSQQRGRGAAPGV